MFVPVTFELTVLGGALAAVLGAARRQRPAAPAPPDLRRARLRPRDAQPLLPLPAQRRSGASTPTRAARLLDGSQPLRVVRGAAHEARAALRARRAARRRAGARRLRARDARHVRPAELHAGDARARCSPTAWRRGRRRRAASRTRRAMLRRDLERPRAATDAAARRASTPTTPTALPARPTPRAAAARPASATTSTARPATAPSATATAWSCGAASRRRRRTTSARLRAAPDRHFYDVISRRLRRDVSVRRPRRAGRPLGDRRLHPRAAAEPARAARRAAGRRCARRCRGRRRRCAAELRPAQPHGAS